MYEFHLRPRGSNRTVVVRFSAIVWPVHSTHSAAVLEPLAGLHCPTVHKETALRVDGATLCKCHQGASYSRVCILGHAYDMADVTKAALANCTKQVVFLGCCCHSVVPVSDYVQAAIFAHH